LAIETHKSSKVNQVYLVMTGYRDNGCGTAAQLAAALVDGQTMLAAA
jgi:hypothetical protein